MSPVLIDELNPETSARVLQQISGNGSGTTGLATFEPHPFYTPAEMRARSILSRIESISAKLKTLENDIRALWVDFENLNPGETILGCATKKEFCEKKLHRHPRTIQYLLAGQSNSADRPHKAPSELSSPGLAKLDANGRVSKAPGETAKPHAEKRRNRNEAVDDFEKVRAVAIKMLNIGMSEMRKTEPNHSLLDAAKTWAHCKLMDPMRVAS